MLFVRQEDEMKKNTEIFAVLQGKITAYLSEKGDALWKQRDNSANNVPIKVTPLRL